MRLPFVSAGLSVFAATLNASTVQLDYTPILNARPVSVVSHGKLVPWSVGIDGGGKADGFATVSAARVHGDRALHALPDDGKFAANSDHPLVQLPYGQVSDSQFQARALTGETQFELGLRRKTLREVSLFFTSARK